MNDARAVSPVALDGYCLNYGCPASYEHEVHVLDESRRIIVGFCS